MSISDPAQLDALYRGAVDRVWNHWSASPPVAGPIATPVAAA